MTDPTQMRRFRVTVRQYNFLTAEIEAPLFTTDDNLREILFGMEDRGEVVWEEDSAETLVTILEPAVEDTPEPPDPTNPDFDGGSE